MPQRLDTPNMDEIAHQTAQLIKTHSGMLADEVMDRFYDQYLDSYGRTNTAVVQLIRKRVSRLIETCDKSGSHENKRSLALGFAAAEGPGQRLETLKQADKNMYAHKVKYKGKQVDGKQLEERYANYH